jgi:hypothetical protein
VGHAEYLQWPATAFLKYTVEAKSAVDLAIRTFTRNADGSYRTDSLDSLQHLVTAMLPAIMGHFETYERYLFAGMFDASVHLAGFDVDRFIDRLGKDVSIDPKRLSGYRGLGAESIGLLIADSVAGWQQPGRVTSFFDAFDLKRQLFDKPSMRRLDVLWQLRHSIVHTGGTLTVGDAQKVAELAAYKGRKLVFEERFVYEVSRKLHPLVKQATEGMGSVFKGRLEPSTPQEARNRINELFTVRSSVSVWLR